MVKEICVFQIDRRIVTHFDFLIPILVIPIIAISYYLISEANTMLANKQLVYFAVGIATFFVFFITPLKKIEWLIPLFYWITIVLLISVEFFGISKLGAKRWLDIPFVHFTIQPSEIFKPAFILMLAYLIKHNPPDENGYGWKSFFKLSGGMKQKMLIAISLAKKNEIIIYDEPTANLDPKARDNFYRLLKENENGKISLFVSHRLDEIKDIVNRQIYMDLGKVLSDEKI